MLKPVLLTALFAVAAPAAHAGDWNFGITFGKDRKPRVHVSYGENRDHHHPRRRVCRSVWVRGHFERVKREIVIPARYESRWIPARFEYRYNGYGERIRVRVRRGHYRNVLVQRRRVAYRYDRVWVAGHSEYRCRHNHHRGRIVVRTHDSDRHDRHNGRRGRRNR